MAQKSTNDEQAVFDPYVPKDQQHTADEIHKHATEDEPGDYTSGGIAQPAPTPAEGKTSKEGS